MSETLENVEAVQEETSENMTEEVLEPKGRHDPAIIRRICPVVDSVCALVICDLLAQRYGTDYLRK